MSLLKRLADLLGEPQPRYGSGYPSGNLTIDDVEPPPAELVEPYKPPKAASSCRCGPDCSCRREAR